MKRFIVFTSALVLAGSVSYAMDEEMDKEMMMEAPAPSVTVGGSAAIGIINEDDDNDATEDFKLIREYKVTFASSGVTDGGLMFGAGISIEDTHDDDPEQEVNGASVYVGSSDGSWKLQFGGNDPGIDLAGGFGVSKDHFGGEDNKDIALSGTFGGTEYRITAADPGLEASDKGDDDWSIGVSHSVNTINVGVGMDSEKGLAIGIGTDLSGLNTSLYWSKSEMDIDQDALLASPSGTAAPGKVENAGLGVKASMSAGEGATFSVAYSTLKKEQNATATAVHQFDGVAETKMIEIDFSYDLGGGATLKAGIDKKDEEKIDEGDTTDGATITQKDTTTLEALISMSF